MRSGAGKMPAADGMRASVAGKVEVGAGKLPSSNGKMTLDAGMRARFAGKLSLHAGKIPAEAGKFPACAGSKRANAFRHASNREFYRSLRTGASFQMLIPLTIR
jgi:hypothetical protein